MILVTIPSATLASFSSGTFAGKLVLEYIAFDDVPLADESASAAGTYDKLFILYIGIGNAAFEMPLLDLARALTVVYSAIRAWRSAALRLR